MKNRLIAFEDKLAATNSSQIVLSGMEITDDEIPDYCRFLAENKILT